jgi:6-phosphogluconolactonase (cycloisomerase 2 family)
VACASTLTNNRIRAFRINPTTGLLTDLGGTGGDGNLLASATATDLSGRFVYTSRFNSDAIEIFAVDQATGMLTPLAGSQSLGGTIAGFAMDPLGRFLFATTFTGYVHAYRMSAATGALTAAGTLLMESGVRGPAIDRTGRFLYPVTRSTGTPGSGGNVHIFAIDQVSGALGLSGVPPVYLGDFNTGQSTLIEATGRFLYVGHGSDTVATFRLSPASGAIALTSEVVTPFIPTSLDTNGPIR